MLYRNKTTGGLIETGCVISGGDWEPVPAPKKDGSKPRGKGKNKGAAGAGSTPAAAAGETGEDAPAKS